MLHKQSAQKIILEKKKIRKMLLFTNTNNIYSIDDIEDNSILRRGVPVAHSIYGVASTINAANYVLFLALEKVQQLGHPDVGHL